MFDFQKKNHLAIKIAIRVFWCEEFIYFIFALFLFNRIKMKGKINSSKNKTNERGRTKAKSEENLRILLNKSVIVLRKQEVGKKICRGV